MTIEARRRAYVAAPLFNDAEKTFNLLLDARLHTASLDTYLPQRDGGEGAEMVRRGLDEATVSRELFDKDVAAVAACDLFVIVLDGRVPDEGACVELGLAHAWNKPCFGLQTDSRRFGGTGTNNLMIDHALDHGISHTLDELVTAVTVFLGSNTLAQGHRVPDPSATR
ncbi:nucleoside 2-deoxyribosyltransferase (plasmid) [Embleya sp. NBC_00888]|uniref:nucleoside 2-deoxyribosyltransferase n=1 Tax=Embleya sp. NBC_00888 TaxID=2975960 RepID=UPI002F90EE86|nr:nucleoside 2-deoxyribosyltransferase [Embleya sp. NBC_00888]